jgi:hypothetical protein
MTTPLLFLLLAGAFLYALRARLKRAPWTDDLDFVTALLTILTIIAAGYWFFVERPESSKLRISQEARFLVPADGLVPVYIAIAFENVGDRAIHMRDADIAIDLRQMAPPTDDASRQLVEQSLAQAFAGAPVPIDRRPVGPLVAQDPPLSLADGTRLPRKTEGPGTLTGRIERGEQHRHLVRAFLPCDGSLTAVIAVVQLANRPAFYDRLFDPVFGTENSVWADAILIELPPACHPEPEGAPK